MKIIFYGKGKRPVEQFINKLLLKDQAKIFACLKSLAELGINTPRVICRQINGKLWEIKINASIGYRIFYVLIKEDLIILLHGYKKKSQKIPTK